MSEKSLVRTAFPQAVAEAIGYYVYRLVDPRNSRTFYVGKGVGNRVFNHIAEASGLPDRSSLKLDLIRQIEFAGERVRYVIHRHGLTEHEAFLVESALIDAYEELSNAVLGHGAYATGLASVDDLVARYDAGEARIDVPAVLLNLNKQYDRALTPEQLYARTRGYWSMRPDAHPAALYAMAVANGIIREVYRIDAWSSSPVDAIAVDDLRKTDERTGKSKVRWMFSGAVAGDIRDRFIGKTVASSSQNPVRWVNS